MVWFAPARLNILFSPLSPLQICQDPRRDLAANYYREYAFSHRIPHIYRQFIPAPPHPVTMLWVHRAFQSMLLVGKDKLGEFALPLQTRIFYVYSDPKSKSRRTTSKGADTYENRRGTSVASYKRRIHVCRYQSWTPGAMAGLPCKTSTVHSPPTIHSDNSQTEDVDVSGLAHSPECPIRKRN